MHDNRSWTEDSVSGKFANNYNGVRLPLHNILFILAQLHIYYLHRPSSWFALMYTFLTLTHQLCIRSRNERGAYKLSIGSV